MSDFDIVDSGNKKSFIDSLNKRKKFGLDDSDSSEEEGLVKKQIKPTKHFHNGLTKTEQENLLGYSTKTDSASQPTIPSNIQKGKGRAHDSSIRSASPQINTASSGLPVTLLNPPILLSSSEEEEEEIKEVRSDFGVDDLDPDIAAYLNESSKAAAEPEKISIKLQYVNDSIQKYENKLLKPMIVIVMNDEQFDKILSTFCKHKKLKKEEVILSYREDKVFLRGTPAGIGMVGPETRTMYVYPVQVWEEKLKKEETKLNKRLKLNQSDDAMEEEEDEKMIIKLRGDDGKEISARVKRSTLLSAAAEMYKKITKIEGKIQLYFEGEPLNLGLAIADTELESEDLLEVVVKN